MPKIQNQKHGTLTESEFLTLQSLLNKGGYPTVRGKEYQTGKTSGQKSWYIEYGDEILKSQ